MKTVLQLITGLLILMSCPVSAQKYQDTLITVKNAKLHYEYDLSLAKEVKARNIDQFIKNQSEPSIKSSAQIQSLLQNIKLSKYPFFIEDTFNYTPMSVTNTILPFTNILFQS